MTYTTTPPSEPGWYWIRLLNLEPYVSRLGHDGYLATASGEYRAKSMSARGYTFGPRIDPPRDDDEEAATVEWLREQGIAEMPCNPGLSFMAWASAIHIDYTDNTGATVTLCWETPTRRKVRQIVEALR